MTKKLELEEIVRTHYASVLAYCRRHAPAEAEDIAQETFLRFSRAEGYKDENRPQAYLITIARNLCIDNAKKAKHAPYSLDFEVAAPEETAPEKSMLGSALYTLPKELQELLELRFDQELKVKDIAEMLGISRFSVRRKINHALSLLRAYLEEHS